MGRMVLLRHDLVDGSWHYDWMFEGSPLGGAAPSEAAGLITFRVRDRPDRIERGVLAAERLAAHRAAYLEYEGPLSGGRGCVTRVAAGAIDLLAAGDDELRLLTRFDGGPERAWGATRVGGNAWEFRPSV